MAEEKRCGTCRKIKPICEFSKDKRSKDGYNYKCKECCHEYWLKHGEIGRAKNAEYIAAHKEELDIKHAEYRDAHREESRAYSASYRESHPYETRLYKKMYNKSERGKAARTARKHRRRAITGSYLSLDTVEKLKAEYGGYCLYCNNKIDDGHIDHIVPIASGGTNDRDNLVYCCATCNRSKAAKSLLEFMIYKATTARTITGLRLVHVADK